MGKENDPKEIFKKKTGTKDVENATLQIGEEYSGIAVIRPSRDSKIWT